MGIGKRALAELIGTFWLVFGGTGSAVIAAAYPGLGIGFLGVAFAFGLTLLTMAYAIGRISGCHINPAVTFGFATAGRFPWKEVIPYVIAQVVGAILGSAVLLAIASGKPGFSLSSGFAANGYADHSPGGYSILACILAEVVLTLAFLFLILKVTEPPALAVVAPIAIGLMLTLIHLVDIPITNASVNPARSTGPAVFVGGWGLRQLWFFWVFPILGGVLGGLLYRGLREPEVEVRH